MGKILIADDEPHIRILLEQTLDEFESKGITILTAENGIEALQLIRTEHPDIVYLDVMMPGMSGYDVCRKAKHELMLEDVYIIMLTARGQEFDEKMGLQAGADMYITKPFDPDAIVKKTAEVLGLGS